MNINQDISGKAFAEIKQLADGHPVFLVTTATEAFVVKAEDSNSTMKVNLSAEVMTFIDPHAASRVLNRREIMAIRNFANANPGSVTETGGTLNQFITAALRPPLPPMPGQRPVSQQTAVMTIMAAKAQLHELEDAANDMLGGDKTKAKIFTKAFNNPNNLKRLGLILAADAFNGNQDRISFDGPGVKVGTLPRLQRIWNPGNVFISDERRRMTVIGLDNFDPASMINQPGPFDKNGYPGVYLRADKAAQRTAMLTGVASDIETLLGPRNRKFSFLQQTRLPANAVQLMEQGMNEGATKILAFLKQKYINGGMDNQMQQRIMAIGWLSRTNFPRL